MDKETSIEITSQMITELTKEMHKEISNFTNAIKSQVNSYSQDPESYEKFKIMHEGPLFAEVNTKMFELLKEIKTIRKMKEAVLSQDSQMQTTLTSSIPMQNQQQSISPYTSHSGGYYVQNSLPSLQIPSPSPDKQRETLNLNHPLLEENIPDDPRINQGIIINPNFRSNNNLHQDFNDSQPRFGRNEIKSPRQQLTPKRSRREESRFDSSGSETGFQIHRSPVINSPRSGSNSPNIINKPETVYSLPKQRLCKISNFNNISIYNRSGTQLFSEQFCLPLVGQKSSKLDQMIRFSKFKDKFLFFVDSHTICFIDARLDILDPIYFKDEEYEIIDACIDEIDENVISINEICTVYYKNYKTRFLSEDGSLRKRGELQAKGVGLSDSFSRLLIGFEYYDKYGKQKDKISLRKKSRNGFFKPYFENDVQGVQSKI